MDTRIVHDFVVMFLGLSKVQRKSLLSNITYKQCRLVRQVSLNIIFNKNIQISEEDRAYIKRNKTALKKLASARICLSDKRSILGKKTPLIYKVFKIVVKYLDSIQSEEDD